MDPTTVLPMAVVQAAAVWLIQSLKRAGWFPWLNHNTGKANRFVAWLIAAAAAAGITFQWQGATRDLIVHVPMFAVVLQGVYTWAGGIVANELTYLLVQLKQQAVPPAEAITKEIPQPTALK